MTKSITLSILAAATGLTIAPAPAAAADFAHGVSNGAVTGLEAAANHGRHRDWRGDHRHGNSRVYYEEPVYRDTRIWRGRDGRQYCRRKDGTTGLLIGGALGALLGRQIDGGYDKSTGTILGAAGGALLGRSIARDKYRCR